MTQGQIVSLLRILLAAGGPIAGLLVNAGMAPGNVNTLLTALLSIVPLLVSAVWGFIGNNKVNTVASAALTEGVKVVSTTPAGQALLDALPPAAKAANQ